MIGDLLEILLTAGFWAATIRIVSPLILGTLGELICERAGVLNLGIEGIFVAGAMAGWLAVYLGAGLWGGVLIAALAGAMFGLLHAFLTVILGLSQPARRILGPIFSALYPVPKIAILPLILLIFGVGDASKFVVIAIGVGMVVFAERPDMYTWAGTCLIVASGLYTLYREQIAGPRKRNDP